MPYTYNKLKGRITELYGTQGNFAKKVGISKNSMLKKLTSKTEFSKKDIIQWFILLNLNKEVCENIFYSKS